MAAKPRATTYSVFVRFKHRRLTLARGLASLERAIAFASGLRQQRFHDPEAVMVIDDAKGEAVPFTSAPPAAEAVPVAAELEPAWAALQQEHTAVRDALRIIAGSLRRLALIAVVIPGF